MLEMKNKAEFEYALSILSAQLTGLLLDNELALDESPLSFSLPLLEAQLKLRTVVESMEEQE
tara:strand:+ start:175 stop:360 length:186 start_codon:yes stop_codon:yes gene_type:complete